MNPWLSQAISQQRQDEIVRQVRRRTLVSGDVPAARRRPSLDTRLGWALIRVGLRLLGDDAPGPTVAPRTTG